MMGYDKYKPSGVEWIDKIPNSWNIFPIKRGLTLLTDYDANGSFSTIKDNVNRITNTDEKYAWFVRATDLENKSYINSIDEIVWVDKKTYDFLSKSSLNENDLMVAKRGEIGKVYLMPKFDKPCTLAPNLYLVRLNEKIIHSKFSFYYFISEVGNNQLRLINKSTTLGAIYKDDFKSIPIIFPPIQDQIIISNYLDEKTKIIVDLIHKKEKIIELLKEERTALINQAVTKGLYPNVKFKPSGVEWLGTIPEHWEVKKIKYIIEGKLKYGANESAELENRDFPRYIRITDFGDNGKLREETFKSLDPKVATEYLLSEGDILFARSGATVGKTFQFKNYSGLACFAGYLIKATPKRNLILSDFLYLFTRGSSYENWKNSIFNQATIQNIGADKYSQLEIALPPISEQIEIIEYLNIEATRIDKLVNRIESEIELIKEYRNTLINEVVTGKIKVS